MSSSRRINSIASSVALLGLLFWGLVPGAARAEEDCTPADLSTVFYDDYYPGTKWARAGEKAVITWTLKSPLIYNESITREPTEAEAATIRQGISSWDLQLESVEFQEIASDPATMTIGWVPMSSGITQAGALGYWNAWWDGDRIRNRATIKLRDNSLISRDASALLFAVQHEVGNVLGLGDIVPTSAFDSVQEDPWPDLSPRAVLSDFDVRMIRTLYSESTCPSTFYKGTPAVTPTPTPTPSPTVSETPTPATIASPVFATVTAKQKKSLNKKFSSCKSLNTVFPGGIASTKGAVNAGAKTKYLAVIHAGTYKLNKSLDRDKDLIICER
jgi:hypothetical protein